MSKEIFLWNVFDGEENHAVGATSAVDALNVLAETWGPEILDDYLEKTGVRVARLNQEKAMNIMYEHEDEGETTLWADWLNDPSRRLIGSSGPY